MTNRIAAALDFAKLMALVVSVVPTIGAQPGAAAGPKFDVASIKPCEDANTGRRSAGGTGSWSPGRLTLNCQTVMTLIRRAYVDFADGRVHVWPPWLPIEGGPGWINSAGYRIEATSQGSQTKGVLNGPMLQALLEDRFSLKLRGEIREVPVYALTVAKGGPRLRPFQEGSCVPVDFEKVPPPPEPGQPDPVPCGLSDVTTKGIQIVRHYHSGLRSGIFGQTGPSGDRQDRDRGSF